MRITHVEEEKLKVDHLKDAKPGDTVLLISTSLDTFDGDLRDDKPPFYLVGREEKEKIKLISRADGTLLARSPNLFISIVKAKIVVTNPRSKRCLVKDLNPADVFSLVKIEELSQSDKDFKDIEESALLTLSNQGKDGFKEAYDLEGKSVTLDEGQQVWIVDGYIKVEPIYK